MGRFVFTFPVVVKANHFGIVCYEGGKINKLLIRNLFFNLKGII